MKTIMSDEKLHRLIGTRMGQLEVIDYLGMLRLNDKVRHIYLVRCNCGMVKAMRRDTLIQKLAKTCGHTNGRTYMSMVEDWRQNEEQTK